METTKQIYDRYLFNKGYLVVHGPSKDSKEVFFSLGKMFGILIDEGTSLLNVSCIRLCEKFLRKSVPEPFYKGFPQSVKDLTKSQKIYDQLISYYETYDLGNFNKARHSIFEKKIERTALRGKIKLKKFKAITVQESRKIIKDIVKDLCNSSRPLSEMQFPIVLQYFKENKEIFPIKSKDTLIKLFLATLNPVFVKDLYLSDAIQIGEALTKKYVFNSGYYRIGKKGKETWKQLKNPTYFYIKYKDRYIVALFLDTIFKNGNHIDIAKCFEKRKRFVALLHHVHYVSDNQKGQNFVTLIRNSKENFSAFSSIEKALKTSALEAAKTTLNIKGNGQLLRSLDYLISRAKSQDEIKEILSLIESKNPIILFQLLLKYSEARNARRIFTFIKNNLLLTHKETKEEISRSRTKLDENVYSLIREVISQKCNSIYKNTFENVYIEESMKNIALPLNESASSEGLNTLPKGSLVNLPEGSTFRFFTYWEKVDDIDLSVMSINKDQEVHEFSWRTIHKRNADWICFSGDQTSGYKGGSEYFDIDIKKLREKCPNIRYLVFNNNVFSCSNFNQCICKAGYMLRKYPNSGEAYEPKTVETSFQINAETSFVHCFAIDVINNQLIWLNLGNNNLYCCGGDFDVVSLSKYFNVAKTLNYYNFFKMASKNLVTDPKKANIVVSDKITKVGESQTLIRSCDIEKVMAFLNKQTHKNCKEINNKAFK